MFPHGPVNNWTVPLIYLLRNDPPKLADLIKMSMRTAALRGGRNLAYGDSDRRAGNPALRIRP